MENTDISTVQNLVNEQITFLIEEASSLAENALGKAQNESHIAAVYSWSALSLQTIEQSTTGNSIFPPYLRVGHFINERLRGSAYNEVTFPAVLQISKNKGLFFRSPQGGGAKSEDLLQSVALRVLCSLPVSCLQLHLVDLQTKGRAFATLSGLDSRIVPKAPITAEEVTTLLKNFERHISDVNRRCLNRHEWLCDYNMANPDSPEPYNIICLSNYPYGLDKESIDAIHKLLVHECAARAGIYLFFSSEKALPANDDFSNIPIVFTEGDKAELVDESVDTSSKSEFSDLMLLPDVLPNYSTQIVDYLNKSASTKPKPKDVSISFENSKLWNSSAASGIEIPIGKAGREDLCFRLGNEAVVHHALIGGATGTGKTILLHNIILNAAELYSPEDLQMILMDFKEGTEFACYDGLPHMRVLSIASELHFGYSVFEWLVSERIKRANLFKKSGVSNLADYIKVSGEKIPRLLVLMDEFQRLLAEPSIGSQVSLLLDDIVRTGRSFGINLVLSTQSLGNVQIEPSTLTSLGLRICLRLSEHETTRFLSYDNNLPAGFNRPGQAIYNDTEGKKEGNTEFQVALVNPSEIPSRCQRLREREETRYGAKIVKDARIFHGELPINPQERLPVTISEKICAYIGEPLKVQAEPLPVTLETQDGANVLAIGQRMEILNTLSTNLAAQYLQRIKKPEIFVSDALPLSTERWRDAIEKGVKFLSNPAKTIEALEYLINELDSRKFADSDSEFSSKILFLIEPHLCKAFPPGNGMDISTTASMVNTLLESGPRVGIHTILISTRLARTAKLIDSLTGLIYSTLLIA